MYGCGIGYVLRRHRFGFVSLIRWSSRSLVSLISSRPSSSGVRLCQNGTSVITTSDTSSVEASRGVYILDDNGTAAA